MSLLEENATKFLEKNRNFVAKWKHRLCGVAKTIEDGRLYDDRWATCGNGSYIEIHGIHGDWYDKIDEYLTNLSVAEPNFKIFQLKLKFGSVNLYLRDVSSNIEELELYDERLVW